MPKSILRRTKKKTFLSKLVGFFTSRALMVSITVLLLSLGYVSYELLRGNSIDSLIAGTKTLDIPGTISDYLAGEPIEIMEISGRTIPLTGDPEIDAYVAATEVKRNNGDEAAQKAAAKKAAKKSAEYAVRNIQTNEPAQTAKELAESAVEKAITQVKSDVAPYQSGNKSTSQQVDITRTCSTSAGFTVGVGETVIGAGDAIYTCAEVNGNVKWMPLSTCGDGDDQCYKSDVKLETTNPNGTVVLTIKPSYLGGGYGRNCSVKGIVVGNGSFYKDDDKQLRCDNGSFTEMKKSATGHYYTIEEEKNLQDNCIKNGGSWDANSLICGASAEKKEELKKKVDAFEAQKSVEAQTQKACYESGGSWNINDKQCINNSVGKVSVVRGFLNLAECLDGIDARSYGCRVGDDGKVERIPVQQAVDKLATELAACRAKGAQSGIILTYDQKSGQCIPQKPPTTAPVVSGDPSNLDIDQPPNASQFTYKVGEVCDAGSSFACARNCAGGTVSVIDNGLDGNIYICGDTSVADKVAKEKGLVEGDSPKSRIISQPKEAGEGCLLEGNNGCKSGICKFGITKGYPIGGWYCAMESGELPASFWWGENPQTTEQPPTTAPVVSGDPSNLDIDQPPNASQFTYKVECGGKTVDTAIDNNNCGQCGTVCKGDQVCIAGVCKP